MTQGQSARIGVATLFGIVLACGGGRAGDESSDVMFAGSDSVVESHEGAVEEASDTSRVYETDTASDLADLRAQSKDAVCVPDCTRRECGDDGCGGNCGQCASGLACVAGVCMGPCTHQGFQAEVRVARWKAANGKGDPHGLFEYFEFSSQEKPERQLLLKINQTKYYNGPTGPATVDIAGSNYFVDPVILILLDGCGPGGCQKLFYAEQGQIEITSLDGANGPFKAWLKGLVLGEAKIQVDGTVGFFKGGETWCFNDYELKAEDVRLLPEDHCMPEGTGTHLYDNIANIPFTNCYGQPFNLHDLCGKFKVVWLVVAAAWCPHCAENLPKYAAYAEKHKEDVALIVYLAHGEYGQPPTQAQCEAYAKSKGIDPARMFLGDPDWSLILQYLSPETTQTGFPFSFVMTGHNMALVWTSAYGVDPAKAISKLLEEL